TLLTLAISVSYSQVVASASMQSIESVQSIYVSYYGRPGDPVGVEWWAEQLDQNGGDLSQIIDQFGNSEEYQERFGDLTTSSLIENLYLQMFGRSVETEGLAWWAGQIDGGHVTLAKAAVEIANGAQDDDKETLTNRTEVALSFTNYVETLDKTFSLEDVDTLRNLILPVDSATDVAAFTSSASFMNAVSALPNNNDSQNNGGIDTSKLEPLITVEPIYPPRLIARGIEGQCTVEFDLSVEGIPLNPVAVDCNPSRLFDRASLVAIQDFRYAPYVVNGEAIEVQGVQYTFTFALEDDDSSPTDGNNDQTDDGDNSDDTDDMGDSERAGEQVYEMSCVVCHGIGAAGAPVTGNVEQWAPRIEKGIDTLVANAINGVNAMPPRGVCLDCSDEEIRAVVEFMINSSQ
ncbi:MAG: TonB family protein, partial [Pseudomonadales bacterium]|nr:TonB family protein [Pseudomonadales bacterium]